MSGSAHGALSSVDAYRAVTKGRRTWLNGCAQIVARAVERGEIPNVHRTTRLIPALIDLLRSSPEEAKAWRGFSGKATAWLALACGGVLLATGETCGRAHNTAGEDDRQQYPEACTRPVQFLVSSLRHARTGSRQAGWRYQILDAKWTRSAVPMTFLGVTGVPGAHAAVHGPVPAGGITLGCRDDGAGSNGLVTR
jgi:cytochrome c553